MTNQTNRGHNLNEQDRSKGGEHAHGGQQHERSASGQGGKGSNFAEDHEKAREAGRKGGEQSHGGRH